MTSYDAFQNVAMLSRLFFWNPVTG
uniref:Uncharacterized protein n=1 Tax=Arundo donax TaxID=35708 RepID=A0A0A9GZZ6_ARUDO